MIVRVKVAETDAEKDALFEARHRCYVEQGEWMDPRPDGRIVDVYDGLSVSVNFMAVCDGVVVGGVRYTEENPLGTVADEMFDFTPHLTGTKRASPSMFFVDHAFQHAPAVVRGITNTFHHYAVHAGCDETYAACSPTAWPTVKKFGVVELADDVLVGRNGLPFIPYKLAASDYMEAFVSYMADHELGSVLDVWDRIFVTAGDTVVKRGELATHAFLVIGGEAVLRREDGATLTIRPHALFGEQLVIEGRRWPYALQAATDLELLAIDLDALMDRVLAHPAVVTRLGELSQGPWVQLLGDGADEVDFDQEPRRHERPRPQPSTPNVRPKGPEPQRDQWGDSVEEPSTRP
ncbi:MAG: cyclic nucleotide-binding domain-containing protein [Alphaproteobacteria bacterium]|nr:cyclic nucleotide-binding domain-containing protein [Alphaproteobacteria bacterium]